MPYWRGVEFCYARTCLMYLEDWSVRLEKNDEACWFLCKYANQSYAEVITWSLARIQRGVKAVYKLYEKEEAAMERALKKK